VLGRRHKGVFCRTAPADELQLGVFACSISQISERLYDIAEEHDTKARNNHVENCTFEAMILRVGLNEVCRYVFLRGDDINRGEFLAGSTPRHQFDLRSFLDLPANFPLDIHFCYVSAIRQLPEIVDGGGISDYAAMDIRLAKQLSKQLEISQVGQNLLHDKHVEFGTPEARGEIQRSVYAKMTWRM